MGNIVLLDELTINQIAAGEVIERPASVVKEMVENSIDAGATNITVDIKNGGISQIKIIDNGKGIGADDVEIAFERHATSKIRSANDLTTVRSMGFRGEALASIAAISNVELVSKTATQETGNKIVVEAGNIMDKTEIACQTGTNITVKNLFFNTPVRYKFLRKDYTEAGYIEDAMTRIALVNPNIAIKLISNGKIIIQTTGSGKLKDVIYSIYGKDIANAILDVEYIFEDYKITGVIGKPEIARSNRSQQLFFVNKRFVRDKALSSAIEQAFKGMIPLGRFGFAILNIDMSPSKVDVNVHPAKLEVRFEEENKVFKTVYHSIKETLSNNELVASTEKQFKSNVDNNSNEIKETEISKQEILNRRASAFEERLKNIREQRKDSTTSGLFSNFRKQQEAIKENKEDEIGIIEENENVIEENSININSEVVTEKNIIEDLFKKKNNVENSSTIAGVVTNNNLVDTSDVLEQLKKMKQSIEQEMQANRTNVEEKAIEVNDIEAQNIKQEEMKVEAENVSDEIQENIEVVEESEDTISIASTATNEPLVSRLDAIMGVIEAKKNEGENEEPEETENNEVVNEQEGQEQEEKEKSQQEMLEKIKDTIEELEENPQIVSEDFNEMYSKVFGKMPIQDVEEEVVEKPKVVAVEEEFVEYAQSNIRTFEKEEDIKPIYKLIGITFKTYIILEIEKEMYILDQHAAHERIIYEKVKSNYYSTGVKDSQLMLLPDVITLTNKEMDIAKDNIELFRKAGFTLEEFGENTIKISGVPTICFDLNAKDLFLETLDEINSVARTARQEKEERFISTVACKVAVKGNNNLNEKEVESLLDELLRLPNPFTCPHGRPTAIKMSKYDIERKFARK